MNKAENIVKIATSLAPYASEAAKGSSGALEHICRSSAEKRKFEEGAKVQLGKCTGDTIKCTGGYIRSFNEKILERQEKYPDAVVAMHIASLESVNKIFYSDEAGDEEKQKAYEYVNEIHKRSSKSMDEISEKNKEEVESVCFIVGGLLLAAGLCILTRNTAPMTAAGKIGASSKTLFSALKMI